MIRLLTISAFCGALTAPLFAGAQGMGPLAAYLESGKSQDGAWQTTATDAGVQMVNTAITRSLNVVQAPTGLPDGTLRHIAVNLGLRGNGSRSALAGLFYGLDTAKEDDPAFYIYALGESGDLGFYRFNGARYEELWASKSANPSKGFNRLEIVEAEDSITLWFNGNAMKKLPFEAIAQGTAGIVAGGIIDVRFGGYSVTPAAD